MIRQRQVPEYSKILLVLAISTLFVSGASAQAESPPGLETGETITQEIELQPGWNSVSFRVAGLSFSEDVKPQCDFGYYPDDGEDYYVWTQKGNEWSHPDDLAVSEGYTFNLQSDESCTVEVTGERVRPERFELEDGWNLKNVPSGLALGMIVSECDLRWYDEQDKFFWVNDGGDWRNPMIENDHRSDDGVYINSNGDCVIDSWPYDGKDSPVTGTAEVTVIVNRNGEPVEGVEVSASDLTGDTSSDQPKTTGSDGTVTFEEDIDSETTHSFWTEAESNTKTIQIQSGDSRQVSIGLESGSDVTRSYDYSEEIYTYDLGTFDLAYLSGVPRDYIDVLEIDLSNQMSIRDIVDETRRHAASKSWQEGYERCTGLSEVCNAENKEFRVSDAENWVLEEGTASPSCYSGEYTPPAYNQYSETVSSDFNNREDSCPDFVENNDIESVKENDAGY